MATDTKNKRKNRSKRRKNTRKLTASGLYNDHDAKAIQRQAQHGIGVINDPTGNVTRGVIRKKDGLDRMLKNGTITQAQLDAARTFQEMYYEAQLTGHITSNYDKEVTSGGTADPHFVPDAVTNARDWVFRRVALLGGYNAPMAVAATHIIGEGHSLDDIAKSTDKQHRGNKHYWRGILVATLTVLPRLSTGALRQLTKPVDNGAPKK